MTRIQLSFKYLKFTPSGWKDIGIRNFEFLQVFWKRVVFFKEHRVLSWNTDGQLISCLIGSQGRGEGKKRGIRIVSWYVNYIKMDLCKVNIEYSCEWMHTNYLTISHCHKCIYKWILIIINNNNNRSFRFWVWCQGDLIWTNWRIFSYSWIIPY